MKKKKLISATLALALGCVSAYAFAMPMKLSCKEECTVFCAVSGHC